MKFVLAAFRDLKFALNIIGEEAYQNSIYYILVKMYFAFC